MELMKNKYLKFDEIDSGIGIVRNTTVLNLLPDIPAKFFTDDYILLKKIEDDKLIEALSYELYNNTDYWDILLVLNGMTNMNQMPVNYDTILVRVGYKIEKWADRGKLMYSQLTDLQIKTKYDEMLLEEINLNETYRNIKYISKNDLSELLSILDKKTDEVKINSDLLVNKD